LTHDDAYAPPSALWEPAGHANGGRATQVDEPISETLSPKHGVHDVAPPLENVFAGHQLHDDSNGPPWMLYEPASHENAGRSVQNDDPGRDVRSRAQGVHLAAPALENVSAGHVEQAAASSDEAVPAGHVAHAVARMPRSPLYCPAGHEYGHVQDVEPSLNQPTWPLGQFVQ
jgi:hypothetical protein